jgi:hypothetical protein
MRSSRDSVSGLFLHFQKSAEHGITNDSCLFFVLKNVVWADMFPDCSRMLLVIPRWFSKPGKLLKNIAFVDKIVDRL